jgi:hypothetical protein
MPHQGVATGIVAKLSMAKSRLPFRQENQRKLRAIGRTGCEKSKAGFFIAFHALVNNLCAMICDRPVADLDESSTRCVEVDQMIVRIALICRRHLRHEFSAFAVINLETASFPRFPGAEIDTIEKSAHEIVRVLEIQGSVGRNALCDEVLDEGQNDRSRMKSMTAERTSRDDISFTLEASLTEMPDLAAMLSGRMTSLACAREDGRTD